jgi:hypothetical protein
MFECEEVPSKDGIVFPQPPSGVQQLAEIAEGQLQIAIATKAFINGLRGAVDGEINRARIRRKLLRRTAAPKVSWRSPLPSDTT